MKLRVLIADPNREFQQMMAALLSRERDMEAADVSSDGLETLAKVKTLRPDVVLLDLVQPRLDGLGVLRRLAAQENAPPVLVLTGFVNSHVIAECSELGAAYFMPKPCDTGELIQRLRKCTETKKKPPDGQNKAPAWPGEKYIKGYQYLREAILFTLRSAEASAGITKVLYPEVAKRFSTTPTCVERAMRRAIEVAWDRGDEEVRQKIFRGTVSANKGKPTNSEFIAMIAEHVSRQILL